MSGEGYGPKSDEAPEPETIRLKGPSKRYVDDSTQDASVEGSARQYASDEIRRREAQFSTRLAYALSVLFAVVIAVPFIAAFFSDKEQYERVGSVFNQVFPVVTGLFGAAVTYYLKRPQ